MNKNELKVFLWKELNGIAISQKTLVQMMKSFGNQECGGFIDIYQDKSVNVLLAVEFSTETGYKVFATEQGVYSEQVAQCIYFLLNHDVRAFKEIWKLRTLQEIANFTKENFLLSLVFLVSMTLVEQDENLIKMQIKQLIKDLENEQRVEVLYLAFTALFFSADVLDADEIDKIVSLLEAKRGSMERHIMGMELEQSAMIRVVLPKRMR